MFPGHLVRSFKNLSSVKHAGNALGVMLSQRAKIAKNPGKNRGRLLYTAGVVSWSRNMISPASEEIAQDE